MEGLAGHWYDYFKIWRLFFPPPELDKKLVNYLKKKKPDILALIEVDRGSFRSKFKDEGLFVERELGFCSLVELVKYPFLGFLRLFHFIPIMSQQSNALLSKYPVLEIKNKLLHDGIKRIVIQVTIKIKKTPVTLFVAHLALGYRTRVKQIKELAELIRRIKHPVILMGDFNTFRGVDELYPLIGQAQLMDAHLLDKRSVQYTYPAAHPERRLDYILISKQVKVTSYQVLKAAFSDHLPVMIEFELKGKK